LKKRWFLCPEALEFYVALAKGGMVFILALIRFDREVIEKPIRI
jgi:hypothetical protein